MNATEMSEDTTIYDVAIIGAGPAGLAVAARLCEHTPSAIFTDDEHQRYHWIKKRGRQMSTKNPKTGAVKPASAAKCPAKYSTLVLDATGNTWMSRWNNLFRTFEISHLRSPMFFHVDPGDRDALLAYCNEKGTEKELVEIAGCVGKEVSKHQKKQRQSGKHKRTREVTVNERDRVDYFTPSSRLFKAHCECVIDRYGLQAGLVRQEAVQDLRYASVPSLGVEESIFTLQTDVGVRYAKTVVLAIGPANAPDIPSIAGMKEAGRAAGVSLPCCHSMEIKHFPDPAVSAKIKAKRETNIAVVGGGLTSAQLADMAIRRGVTRVWHLMRGDCKVKPFDVDLPWMGKFRNLEQSIFWSADSDEERLEQIKAARGGGSMTPGFFKIEKAHMAAGRIKLHQRTSISRTAFCPTSRTWKIETEPAIPDLPPIDYIYFATGIQTDFTALPFLKNMLADFPIHGHGGLPCLNDDLMWKDGVPLYVTGRLAGLRLGPAGGNLGGARVGAERIAWSIGDHLGRGTDEEAHSDDVEEYARGTAGLRGNRYSSFAVETEEGDL